MYSRAQWIREDNALTLLESPRSAESRSDVFSRRFDWRLAFDRQAARQSDKVPQPCFDGLPAIRVVSPSDRTRQRQPWTMPGSAVTQERSRGASPHASQASWIGGFRKC